jgi:hypothetical protein
MPGLMSSMKRVFHSFIEYLHRRSTTFGGWPDSLTFFSRSERVRTSQLSPQIVFLFDLIYANLSKEKLRKMMESS